MDETTTNAGDEGTDETSSRFGRAREYASAAGERVRDGYNRVRERVDEVDMGAMTDQVRGYVRSNPGKALLISVGIGFVIGLMLRGGGDDED